jgi:hypothetical protein
VTGKATMMVPGVLIPWQLPQVPSPGAPLLPMGGLTPNADKITGTARTAAILAVTIRRFVMIGDISSSLPRGGYAHRSDYAELFFTKVLEVL